MIWNVDNVHLSLSGELKKLEMDTHGQLKYADFERVFTMAVFGVSSLQVQPSRKIASTGRYVTSIVVAEDDEIKATRSIDLYSDAPLVDEDGRIMRCQMREIPGASINERG